MLTIAKLAGTVHRLQQKHITQGKARRFFLGVSQFSLKEYSSLNAAGRSLGVNRFTGENRVRRTVSDSSLADQLQQLLLKEALTNRTGLWYFSLDHSQFGPFCVAVLAMNVRSGRAIPLWCQVNLSEAALMLPLLKALGDLLSELEELSPRLKSVLVMDRWFAADRLFQLLNEHQAYFIARTKSNKRVQLPWDPSWWRLPISELSFLETNVTYRSHKFRLIRSVLKPGMKDDEPWFLLTNLPEEITRRMVLNRYAERFEIEEAFKDLKWLNRLEWQRVRKSGVIRCLLLFVFLGWWLVWRYVAQAQVKPKLHPNKQLSWFRLAWEELQRLLYAPLLVTELQIGVKK